MVLPFYFEHVLDYHFKCIPNEPGFSPASISSELTAKISLPICRPPQNILSVIAGHGNKRQQLTKGIAEI